MTWAPVLPPGIEYKKQNLKDLAKTANFIYQIGESQSLRLPSPELTLENITSSDYASKFAYLKKCMRNYRDRTGKGKGIAAVQVGIPERFFVLYTPKTKEKLTLFINPKITNISNDKYSFPEACMSCNSLIAHVIRPAWIEFTYLTEKGIPGIWSKKDTTQEGRMYNRVVQHELDHLDGIINIDKVPSRELIFESNKEFYEKATFKKV